MSIESAPPEVKLAIDLIMLLEQQHLPPKLVLDALAIVERDYQRKLQHTQDIPSE